MDRQPKKEPLSPDILREYKIVARMMYVVNEHEYMLKGYKGKAQEFISAYEDDSTQNRKKVFENFYEDTSNLLDELRDAFSRVNGEKVENLDEDEQEIYEQLLDFFSPEEILYARKFIGEYLHTNVQSQYFTIQTISETLFRRPERTAELKHTFEMSLANLSKLFLELRSIIDNKAFPQPEHTKVGDIWEIVSSIDLQKYSLYFGEMHRRLNAKRSENIKEPEFNLLVNDQAPFNDVDVYSSENILNNFLDNGLKNAIKIALELRRNVVDLEVFLTVELHCIKVIIRDNGEYPGGSEPIYRFKEGDSGFQDTDGSGVGAFTLCQLAQKDGGDYYLTPSSKPPGSEAVLTLPLSSYTDYTNSPRSDH